MSGGLLLDARIEFEVAEFGECAASPANQVVMVASVRKLVPDRPILQRYPANEVQFLQQLDRPEHGGASHLRKVHEQIFDREGTLHAFDGVQDRLSRGCRAESNRFEAARSAVSKRHAGIVSNGPSPHSRSRLSFPMMRAHCDELRVAVSASADVQVPRQLVLFRVGETRYAVDIESVDEILPVLPITALPGAPGGVLGLADVRKQVVPVFDLHWKFGVANGEITSESRMILVETADGNVAMLVDAVEEVLTVTRDDYQSVEAPGSRRSLGYLSGVIRREQDLVLWIDHERVVPGGLHSATIAA